MGDGGGLREVIAQGGSIVLETWLITVYNFMKRPL